MQDDLTSKFRSAKPSFNIIKEGKLTLDALIFKIMSSF